MVDVEKRLYDLGREASPMCKKGRHDRCAAYDNMVVRCTCACHGKTGTPDVDWLLLLEHHRREIQLRPPARAAAIIEAERRLGHPLPGVLAAFFRQTDGFVDTAGEWEPAWSLGRLLAENSSRRGPHGLPPRLLAFGDDGAGDWFCLWADAHEPTTFHFSWIDLTATAVAPDLRTFWPGWLDGTIRV